MPKEKASLARKSLEGLAFLVVAMAACLFLPAWTLAFWPAWLFLAVFTSCVSAITLYFLRRDPALIARRLSAGPAAEKQRSQQIIQGFASLAFLGLLVLPGFDRHFHWTFVPLWLVVLGDLLVGLGLLTVFFVFRANSFTSATIEVGEGQTLATTGPYALVRHPMYAGAFVMILGMPFALASYWAFVPVVVMYAVIIWRLLEEEKFLAGHLAGYAEYRRKTPYRLVPFVW